MPLEPTIIRESSRKNGWSLPPHPLQFIAWIFVIYFIFIYFTTLAPALTVNWQPAAYIINGIGCLIHIISHFVAATVNPADPAVLKKNCSRPPGTFDRKKHRHVIENQYCYLCEVNVGSKSKHCSACNKCIAGFDHHCKWLNNCVGSSNYKWFLCTLVSGLVGTFMVFSVSLVEFIGYFVDKEDGRMLYSYQELTSSSINLTVPVFEIVYQPVSEEAWLGVIVSTGLLGLLAIILLVHLFIFHVYLMCKDMSTYDYIVRMRERDQMRNAEEPKYATPKGSARTKANRVTPSLSKATGGNGELTVDKKTPKRRELAEYTKALEERERLEGSGPPSPLSNNKDKKQNFDSETKIKKLKRRKRKSLASDSERQEVSTIGNQALYKTPTYNERPLPKSQVHQQRKLPKPKTQITYDERHSDTEESLNEVNHNKSVDRHSPDSGAYVTGGYSNYSSPNSLHSPTSKYTKDKKQKKKKKPSAHILSDEESNSELNSTTMFTLNESAKLNADGSLDYSNGFQTLPLTPIQKRKRHNEIPPLDLSTLRSSTESHNTYKPYSGGLRDSDTYRFLDREKMSNPLLKSVPELHGGDTEL